MSTQRPDLETMWHLAFDDGRMRLRVAARGLVLTEYRCRRRRHLQAYALRSAYGAWVAWRAMRGVRDVWSQEWLDLLPDEVEVTCHCNDVRRVDVSALRDMR